jgi:tetratricopeptide (TPR) repeat protein
VNVALALESFKDRRVVAAVSIVISALICYQAARNWLADFRLQSSDSRTMERGVALEPGNGNAWDRLGRYHQWNLENPDPAQAIGEFEHATHDDPRSAHFLMDLAGAYEAAGDSARSKEAWERARSVYPASAEVDWNFANFLLRQRQFSEAYAEIHKAVLADPKYLPLAISRVWRSSRDVNQLLDHVLPPENKAYFEALDFFASNQLVDPGLEVWRRLILLGQPFHIELCFPFLNEVIQENRSSEAREIWDGALKSAGVGRGNSAESSLLWNGDFSQDFVNGGLGWRWSSPLGTVIDFDLPPQGVAGRSVRIDFGGGVNLDLNEPIQYVPVEPGRTYHFKGFIRTESISTESGMRFLICDSAHPDTIRELTEGITGTKTWTLAEVDIAAGPDTHFLVVSLRRIPSRLFENKLSGTVWIAGLSLATADQSREPAKK